MGYALLKGGTHTYEAWDTVWHSSGGFWDTHCLHETPDHLTMSRASISLRHTSAPRCRSSQAMTTRQPFPISWIAVLLPTSLLAPVINAMPVGGRMA